MCSSVKTLSNGMSNSRCSVCVQITSLQVCSCRHIIVSWTWRDKCKIWLSVYFNEGVQVPCHISSYIIIKMSPPGGSIHVAHWGE